MTPSGTRSRPGPATTGLPDRHDGLGPLRIGIIAPISWRVPPRHYGPWEQFVSLLTEGLVARGVDVTLFATSDSLTSARLVGGPPTGYSEDPSLDAGLWEARHVAAAFEQAGEFLGQLEDTRSSVGAYISNPFPEIRC